jgi:hypothetical protein
VTRTQPREVDPAAPSGALLRSDGTRYADAFRRREPTGFGHELHHHPLLTLESIAGLADALPRESVIYDTADQALLVPEGGPPRGALDRPGDVIRNLDENRSWLTLLNIEQHPDYAELMNRCLDEVQARLDGRGMRMRKRAGFVFVSSPGSTTPAHFDIEHSLIMQVRGAKRLTFGRFERPQDERDELLRYWGGSHGRIETLPPELVAFDLVPGLGAYIPPVAPHWVHNGDAVSISVTLTCFTPDTDRESLAHAFNARLRRLRGPRGVRLTPRWPGESPLVDRCKAGVMRAYALRRYAGLGRRGERPSTR